MAKKITKKERKALKALERNIYNKHNIDEGNVTPATDVVVNELAQETFTVDGIDLFFTEMPKPSLLTYIQSYLKDDDGFGFGGLKALDIDTYGDNKGVKVTWMSEAPVENFNVVNSIFRLRNIFRDTPQYDGCEFYCRTEETNKVTELVNHITA